MPRVPVTAGPQLRAPPLHTALWAPAPSPGPHCGSCLAGGSGTRVRPREPLPTKPRAVDGQTHTFIPSFLLFQCDRAPDRYTFSEVLCTDTQGPLVPRQGLRHRWVGTSQGP